MYEVLIHKGRRSKKATIRYFDKANSNFLTRWKNSIPPEQANFPSVRDSMDLAHIAFEKWKIRKQFDNYATSIEEFDAFITDNPRAEVANFIVLECNWLDPKVNCVCHFRRTWNNNLFIDYLAVHPKIILGQKYDKTYDIKGIGRAMMQYLCDLAKRYDCNCIWGETTQNSISFYKRIFELDEISDILLIPKDKYLAFLNLIIKKSTK